MEKITHITDSNFDSEVLQSELPVVIDYWAEWCGPCKTFSPVFEEVSKEYKDTLRFCKMDVDANQETPAKLGIRGIPTLMIFKAGALAATKVGALSRKQFCEFIDASL